MEINEPRLEPHLSNIEALTAGTTTTYNPSIVHVAPDCCTPFEAFRNLVARCLRVKLPSPAWETGYYYNPLNRDRRVLVYSLEDSGRTKCLVINEDMTYVEIVSGFRRDVSKIERILSSLHLERLLRAFQDAPICTGWRQKSLAQKPDVILKDQFYHAVNCWGVLDAAKPTAKLCPPCSEAQRVHAEPEKIEVPIEVRELQKKTVQKFRCRMRVHFCRKRAQKDEPCSEPICPHQMVNISFEHNSRRITVLLDKLYEESPEVFQSAMMAMTGLGRRPHPTRGNKRRFDDSGEHDPLQLSQEPVLEKGAVGDVIRFPQCIDNTMILQIQQVLNDGRVETRQVYLNSVDDSQPMLEEGDEGQLPIQLQDLISEIQDPELPPYGVDAIIGVPGAVDLGEGLPSEEAGLALEDMQLEMDDANL